MKTTVEINGAVYEIVPQKFGAVNWVASCDLCDCLMVNDKGDKFCGVAAIFECRDYDTDTYNVHLERLATPLVRLNTPSEARRRTIV